MAVSLPPLLAEIVTDLAEVTVFVVIVRVATVLPAGTVTLAGTVATAVELLVRVTTAPPDGAGPVKVTVPVDEVPPFTEVGFKLSEVSVAAVTVKVVLFVAP